MADLPSAGGGFYQPRSAAPVSRLCCTLQTHACEFLRHRDRVRRRAPVHPEFRLALRMLAPTDVPAAAALRLLIPTAARLGVARPSYSSVRRILITERIQLARRRRRLARREQILADLLAGLVMRPLWLATQAGVEAGAREAA